MNYKYIVITLFFLLSECTIYTDVNIINDTKKIVFKDSFNNKGFALIYSDELHNTKKISRKLNDRDLIIFQKNLKKGSTVKVNNIINGKSVIAKVGQTTKYPKFNNSVITKRIADEIQLDLDEPYVEILEILNNSAFVAKKSKTFDEEKQVANKAPVDSISINNLNSSSKKKKPKKKKKFDYSIKIADFYFKDTAKSMRKRIKNETRIRSVKIIKINNTKYRVLLGPFNNINSLQMTFNDIDILEFENLEIIKND
tara:strand:+ start:79 stop:843 length:765 start_codon:yes stop_codon:yes gene_type:complete